MRKRIKDPRMTQLRQYVRSSGVRVEEVAREIGVTGRTVYNWMEGKGRISPLASDPLNRYLANVLSAVARGER